MRLIDAEDLANDIDGSQCLDTEHDYEEVARYIEECPTVDAVPVVRCKDCKHYNAGFECLVEGYGIERPSEWYCADGERREEDDDDSRT